MGWEPVGRAIFWCWTGILGRSEVPRYQDTSPSCTGWSLLLLLWLQCFGYQMDACSEEQCSMTFRHAFPSYM